MFKKNLYLIITLVTLFVLGGIFIFIEYTNYTKVDYKYLTGIKWQRDYYYNGEFIDQEFIYFSKEGLFSYYYGVGNAVDDYDLCDSYIFNKETKIINFNCPTEGISEETLSGIIDEITVKLVTKNRLILIFNEEERVFEPSK